MSRQDKKFIEKKPRELKRAECQCILDILSCACQIQKLNKGVTNRKPGKTDENIETGFQN